MNLSRAKWFTKLDIRGAYNLIRTVEEEERETTFHTYYGLFKSLVMPFSLTNTPTTFHKFINDVLTPYLDRVCTAYLDKTLIYSNTFQEHQQHINLVLEVLENTGLYLIPEKYVFRH
jgi:hypothetical protein